MRPPALRPHGTHIPDPAPALLPNGASMPDYYLLNRADITTDYITARRARELYAEAQADPNANLYGDLETCFYFWSFDTETGLKLICYTVTPAEADEVPEDVREQLNTPTDDP